MARILLAWELGEGMGHLLPLKPLLQRLCAAGHELVVAAVDLASARRVLGSLSTRYVQAPRLAEPVGQPRRRCRCFAELLILNGYEDPTSLAGRHAAWGALADLFQPDLVLAEHSPGALLMARSRGIPAVHAGVGFTCPPDRQPILIPGQPPGQSAAVEAKLVDGLNELLKRHGGRQLDRLGQLFNDVAELFLLTFAELDHLGPREGATYYGVAVPSEGVQPAWTGEGTRTFAYLKPFPALEALLTELRRRNQPVILVPDRIDPALLARHAGGNLQIITSRHDMQAVVREARLIISNGNHGTSAAAMLGGVPLLAFPLHQEQETCALRMRESGLAGVLPAYQPSDIAQMLDLLTTDATVRDATSQAARRHRNFDFSQQVATMAQRVERLL